MFQIVSRFSLFATPLFPAVDEVIHLCVPDASDAGENGDASERYDRRSDEYNDFEDDHG